ncbi:MAG: type II toxin-antitoxin system Phd/YefM family antitoxin [Candidatus Scalindua sp.]|nr:type II toxin-antitoxin system Phd/YefM family antitoxin [Candidatus Scalindua sp.]
MKTMAITKFKAYALKIVDQVAKSNESLVITKRGKPLAVLIPYRKSEKKPVPGKLAGTLVFEKDIVTPLGNDIWEACK